MVVEKEIFSNEMSECKKKVNIRHVGSGGPITEVIREMPKFPALSRLRPPNANS